MFGNHCQIHFKPSSFISVGFADKVNLSDTVSYPVTNMLPIDQFFSQNHNLRNGCIDTSPSMLSNPQVSSHIQFMDNEESLPSDMSVDDIHNMVVSKHCQTLAEVNTLRHYRPDLEKFKSEESLETENSPETAQSVAS